jgi:hypothetical protein
MSLKVRVAAIATLSLLTASPCLALSLEHAPVNSDGSSRIADPDDAAASRFAQFAASSAGRDQVAEPRGTMVTYDLSAAPRAKAGSGYDALRANPGDARFNPFMADAAAPSGKDAAGR